MPWLFCGPRISIGVMTKEVLVMYPSNTCSHYFIVRNHVPVESAPDLILSPEGAANITSEDLDFSGRTFRILSSPFQKSCYAFGQIERDQVPDGIRILRKAYPELTQLIFPKIRSGRKVVSDYGRFSEDQKRAFRGFMKARGITLEAFILDPKYLMVIDGPDDILSDMIQSRLFDLENVSVLENLNDPELIEKYSGAAADGE